MKCKDKIVSLSVFPFEALSLLQKKHAQSSKRHDDGSDKGFGATDVRYSALLLNIGKLVGAMLGSAVRRRTFTTSGGLPRVALVGRKAGEECLIGEGERIKVD